MAAHPRPHVEPRPLRVTFVSRVKRNPYVDLLCAGLRQPGLGLEPRIVDSFSAGWMWRHRREVDVLHIHWLELLFVYPSLARSLKRWLSVMLGLLLARLSGICVVYTVHNLQQHEGQRPMLAWLGNRVIFALAQALHVHDADTAALLERHWGRRRGVYVIPHGHYMTAYANTCTRSEARQRLGLDDTAFVYLFLGRVRPYKGLEELLAAFATLADRDAVLLVAGEAQEPIYAERLRALAGDDARLRLHLGFVADDALQLYLHACDVCVLPYRHVTTSGAAILAFSFGVPIVAPRLGCFVSLVEGPHPNPLPRGEGMAAEAPASPLPLGEGAIDRPSGPLPLGEGGVRGMLYDAQAPDGLCAALSRARRADLGSMRAACLRYAAQLDWKHIARQHAAMYRQCRLHTTYP